MPTRSFSAHAVRVAGLYWQRLLTLLDCRLSFLQKVVSLSSSAAAQHSASLLGRRLPLPFGIALAMAFAVFTAPSHAADVPRCVVAELYLVGDARQQQADESLVATFLAERQGIVLRKYVVSDGDKAAERYQAVCQHYKIEPAQDHAIFYALNRPVVLSGSADGLNRQMADVFRCELFVRTGCSRCAQAKPWINRFVAQFPALRLELSDVVQDPSARSRIADLSRRYGTAAASFPVFHFCNQLAVGWDSERSSGKRIENVLKRWSVACPQAAPDQQTGGAPRSAAGLASRWHVTPATYATGRIARVASPVAHPIRLVARRIAFQPHEREPPPEPAADSETELPIGDPPWPQDATEADTPSAIDEATTEPAPDSIELPLLGEVRVSSLGLPLFTLIVGLIDGFNPCAMWVLVFLLSVLVNLKNRAKMLAVAGTFVIVSGVAYFAFIAAWLNLLDWVGLLRPVQITLALLAIVIGSIHVKDFFAFHRGITLSIPESAKPGIYARVRKIVMAETLWAAILGAMVLAVLVNFIELLCTAGLPAMYSQILTLQGLPAWREYLYLGLYIAAYMFDDTLMVMGVVATLGHPKMQETHGRWLKLLSGAVVLALGLVMLLRPEWLG